jgi:hypothetical protein
MYACALMCQFQIVPETLTTCTWHATHCVSIVHTHHSSSSNSNSVSNTIGDVVTPLITIPNSEALCNECLITAMKGMQNKIGCMYSAYSNPSISTHEILYHMLHAAA